MTSSSGASVHALQKPKRAVMTATRNGSERNATVFARFWVESLRDPAADTDKNEVISALEAFTYADRQNKQFYETRSAWPPNTPPSTASDKQGPQLAGRFPLMRIGSDPEAPPTIPPNSSSLRSAKKSSRRSKAETAESRHADGRLQEAARRALARPGENAAGVGSIDMRRWLIFALALPLAWGHRAGVSEADLHYGRRAEAKSCYTPIAVERQSRHPGRRLLGTQKYTEANTEFRRAVAQSRKPLKSACAGAACSSTASTKRTPWISSRKPGDRSEKRSRYARHGNGSRGGFRTQGRRVGEESAELDPKLVEAQELLASIALEDNNPEKAAAEADKALKISIRKRSTPWPSMPTIDWLDDKPDTDWMDAVLKINPPTAKPMRSPAHFFVINRRYEEGIAYYRKALELDPDLSAAPAPNWA